MTHFLGNILRKSKKYSWKFWASFWLIAVILLTGWFVYLQIKNRNIQNLKPLVKIVPIGAERRNELEILANIYQKMGGFRGEKTFLILFQNNLELRPGGGFIGSFGIVKTNNGKISDVEVHDTGIFDGRIPNTKTPPQPLSELAFVKSWKLRDSNWSPDFRANAEKAEYFYRLGGGTEDFDGVIGVNSDVLNSFLSVTGPVKIDDFPGEYNDQTAILLLEYQVEKGFLEQGIGKEGRKDIMKDLAAVLVQKAHNFKFSEQLEMLKKIEEHLKKKDIQLFFKDNDLQKEIEETSWSGSVKSADGDYLMISDANMNSLKSDYCIKRKIDYNVDLSSEKPRAVLNLTYLHTCKDRDWMTTNYTDWLRVYAPSSSFLSEAAGQDGDVQFAEDFSKKVFAMKVFVPLGQSKTITLKYELPETVRKNPYSLLLEKQSGAGEIPVEISVRKSGGL